MLEGVILLCGHILITTSVTLMGRIFCCMWRQPSKPTVHLLLYYINGSPACQASFVLHIFLIQQAETVAELDKTIGYLLDEMTTHDLLDRVNVVLISDHGMTETTRHRAVVLSRFVESSWYSAPQLSSTGYIYPIPGISRTGDSWT